MKKKSTLKLSLIKNTVSHLSRNQSQAIKGASGRCMVDNQEACTCASGHAVCCA